MDNKDYQTTIRTDLTPKEVLERISHVSQWWSNDFEGKSENINDVFTVRFKSGDMYRCKISEFVPDRKLVWNVIDAYQGWHDKHTEWVGTKIVWEVLTQKEGTEVKLTHVGLVPEFECFDKCSAGWSYLTQNSLLQLLNGDPVDIDHKRYYKEAK